MKAKLLAIVLASVVIAAFRVPVDNSLATVNRENGIYIFIECRPAGSYDVLGSVKKTGLVMNGKAREMVKIITRRAVNDYPNCDGVIFNDLSLDQGTCIKFK